MTTMLALSVVGIWWLAAGTILWGIFVTLGLRFELPSEALSALSADHPTRHGLTSEAEAARI